MVDVGTNVKSRRHTVVTAICVAGAVALAVAGGIGAMLAAAAGTARPAVFLTAGVVTFVVLDSLGAALVARRAPTGQRRAAGTWMFTTSAILLLAVFAVTALIPPAGPVQQAARSCPNQPTSTSRPVRG